MTAWHKALKNVEPHIYREWYVWCHKHQHKGEEESKGCHHNFTTELDFINDTPDKFAVVHKAKEEGWTWDKDGNWLCPECSRMVVPESGPWHEFSGPWSALDVEPFTYGALLVGTQEDGREVLCRYDCGELVESWHPVPDNYRTAGDEFLDLWPDVVEALVKAVAEEDEKKGVPAGS